MKRSRRWILCLLAVAAVLTVLTLSAAAAPAKPGTHADSAVCKSHPGTLLTLSEIEETAAKRNARTRRAPAIDPTTADLPLLVIVIGFNNMPYRNDFNWAQEIFCADRSLAEYYTDMSFGKFTFTPVQEQSAYDGESNTNTSDAVNDGIVHVTLPTAHADWRLEDTLLTAADRAANQSLSEALIAAIEAADAYVDFSVYDVNSDGAITTDEMALGFVVAGYEASSSSGYPHGKAYYLWSNAYSLQETKALYGFTFDLPDPDGVTVNSYIAISEQEDDNTQEPISTLAHELGHYLGLPDLYDTLYSYSGEWIKYDVSDLSLMSGGLYGVDPDTGARTPYSLDAWSRAVLGWAEPETAGLTGDYTLTAQNYENDADYSMLRIDTQHAGEYYLLENRSFLKWDAGLADEYGRDNGGIILWHIDDAVIEQYFDANEVNSVKHRPGVMPLYVELSNDAYTFIGGNSRDKVYLEKVFFDQTIWNEQYASMGTSLDLPLYGTGSSANLRSGRTLSGTEVRFLSEPALSMQVRINPDLHIHAGVYTVVNEPTCTDAGAAYYLCEGCGKHFADEACTVEIDAPFTLDPLGHDTPVFTVAAQPTCTGSGAAYYLCERCGKHFADAACANEIETSFALAPLGHAWGGWTVTKQPTCTQEGQQTRTCTRDGSHKETLPIAKKAHTDNGKGYCKDCGADLKASQRCKYCGEIHTGPFGWLIKFFHSILAIFKR